VTTSRLACAGERREALPAERSPALAGGVTRRAVLLGMALLLVIAPLNFYVEVVVGGGPGDGVPARVPVVVLFLLTLALTLPLLRRLRLSRQELFVVYLLLLIGAPLAHRAVLFYLLTKTPVYYYLARAFPDWEHTLLPLLPAWWSPSSPEAVNGLFVGRTDVPWRLWYLPLAAWGSFLLCLWLSTLCLLVLIHRQWVHNERLSFPVAQIPLDMVQSQQPSGPVRLAAGRVFWIGLAASATFVSLDSLQSYFPAVPAIPIVMPLTSDEPRGIFEGVTRVMLYLSPSLTALLYLVPKDISFSCWFFWLLHQGITIAANLMGISAQSGSSRQSLLPSAYQGIGTVYALLLWVLWVGRRHLLAVLKSVLGIGVDDCARLYRWALLGLIVSLAWMVYLCRLSGCRASFALLLLGLIVGYYLVWARLRAETGLGVVTFPTEITSVITDPAGSAWLRPAEIVTLFTMRWATWVTPDATVAVCTGHALEALKIADSARLRASRLLPALIGAFVLSLTVGATILVRGLYHYGFFGTFAGAANYWPSLQMREDGATVNQLLTSPQEALHSTVPALLFGAVAAITLASLRLRFWWWPFHPIGFLVANAPDMGWDLFPFLIAWACKALVIRFGGLRLYRNTVPLAVGLIVGDLVSGTFWAAVGIVVRGGP